MFHWKLNFVNSKLNIAYINDPPRLLDRPIHVQRASEWSQALLKSYNVSENGICLTSSVKHLFCNVKRLASSISVTVNIDLSIWSSALTDGGNDSWCSMFEVPQQAFCSILHNQPMAIRKCGPKSCMNTSKFTIQIDSCRYNIAHVINAQKDLIFLQTWRIGSQLLFKIYSGEGRIHLQIHLELTLWLSKNISVNDRI